jgi:hypothetical protein
MAGQQVSGTQRGHFYDFAVRRMLSRLSQLPNWLPALSDPRRIDVRHPFLSLPLIEFTLRLPYHLRTDAYKSKPILRAAVAGILPEIVRRRITKGGLMEPRICWAFRRERVFLERLLSGSTLADLGCIEPKKVIEALDRSAAGVGRETKFLYAMLSLETWFSVRSGRCIADSRSINRKEHMYETDIHNDQRPCVRRHDYPQALDL